MKLKNGLDNPYTDLFEWLETEEIDNEAMIETIQSLNQLRETQEKLKGKLVSMENDLNTLKAGKSNIKSIFSFKSKAEDIQSLENSKQNLETNLDHLDKIILIATHNLNNHITNYKEKKLNEYYAHLKLFTQLQMSVSKEMNEIWSLISSDKNLQ